MAQKKTKANPKSSPKAEAKGKAKASPKAEEVRAAGEKLAKEVKKLVKEGNARRIIIKDGKGKVLVEIPLTVAAAGAVFAPTLAAIGTLAALAGNCSLEFKKK